MTVGWHPKLAWKSRKINMQDKQTWPTAHLPSLSLSLSNATLNHQHESATKLECEAKVRANKKVLIR